MPTCSTVFRHLCNLLGGELRCSCFCAKLVMQLFLRTCNFWFMSCLLLKTCHATFLVCEQPSLKSRFVSFIAKQNPLEGETTKFSFCVKLFFQFCSAWSSSSLSTPSSQDKYGLRWNSLARLIFEMRIKLNSWQRFLMCDTTKSHF